MEKPMINREKVKDMTHMAIYETGRGEKELRISSYRRADYVALQMIWSFILGTIAFGIFVLFFFLIKVDYIETLNTLENIKEFVMHTGTLYLIFLAIYLVSTFFWARRKHKRCCENIVPYTHQLNRVARSYQESEEE